MSTPEVSAIGTTVSSPFTGGENTSNTKIDIMKKISESKAQKIGRTMVSEYCISMNKHMTKSVSAIVDKLDINNQTDIIENIANNFFDDDLTDMYISELKATMKVQIKQNLRGILYDHFKSDLEEEKTAEKEREEAEQEGGAEKDAAGAGPESEDESMFHDVGEEDESAVGEEDESAVGEEDESAAGQQGESAASDAGADAADMMNQIIQKINDKITTDDTFIQETRDGIIKNITSGTFKAALQREVFHRLTPQIETLMKERIESILNNAEIKDAAIDVIKGQQKLYNIQNKRGGNKHTIKKTKKNGTNRTRKLSQ
jgi:cation transport regulator ChaB